MLTIFVSCGSRQEPKPYAIKFPTLSMDTNQIRSYLVQYDEGKVVFMHYCPACHTAPDKHSYDNITFDDLFQRLPRPSEEYFARFLTDQHSLKSSGDKYFKALEQRFNYVSIEHRFKDSLKPSDLYNLIVYFKIATQAHHPK